MRCLFRDVVALGAIGIVPPPSKRFAEYGIQRLLDATSLVSGYVHASSMGLTGA